MRLLRGLALAASLAALPGLAGAQPVGQPILGCRLIRAMANADGAGFRTIRVGMVPPYLAVAGQSVVAASEAAIPSIASPRHCTVELAGDDTGFACFWGDAAGLYDGLLQELGSCLRANMTPPTGPHPYAGAQSVRRSETEVSVSGGTATVRLDLIESSSTATSPGDRYIQLGIDVETAHD